MALRGQARKRNVCLGFVLVSAAEHARLVGEDIDDGVVKASIYLTILSTVRGVRRITETVAVAMTPSASGVAL